MSRRSQASLLAFALLLVLWIVVLASPAQYAVFSPGPTFDLLGKEGKAGDVIKVIGHPTYRDRGQLRMLTVSPTGPDQFVDVAMAFAAWLNPDQDVFRYSDIYAPSDNPDTVQEQGSSEMTTAQDTAVSQALLLMHRPTPATLQVAGIVRGGPADGALEVHDQITAVNLVPVSNPQQVAAQMAKVKPGSKVTLSVVRAGKALTIPVGTIAATDGSNRARMMITVGMLHRFPFQVDFSFGAQIGGPSGGMMLTLATYDVLTPGSLTGGQVIAGTGTIDDQGAIGPIGGIEQKIAAARDAKALLFLAPAGDCDEVSGGSVDPGKMRIAAVSTIRQALDVVDRWRGNHQTPLPTCRSAS